MSAAKIVDDWIDWRAVGFAVSGVRMKLDTAAEKRMAVRMLTARMVSPDVATQHITSGMLTAAEVARLIGTSPRNVERIQQSLPAATAARCEHCGMRMWVIDATRVIEEHPNQFGTRCQKSGEPA